MTGLSAILRNQKCADNATTKRDKGICKRNSQNAYEITQNRGKKQKQKQNKQGF